MTKMRKSHVALWQGGFPSLPVIPTQCVSDWEHIEKYFLSMKILQPKERANECAKN
jgi:hypothetical protein